jgi:hypothetical protein
MSLVVRSSFMLLLGSCYLIWYYDQQLPRERVTVPKDVLTISAREEFSVQQMALHQIARPVETISAEPRPWFSRIRYHSAADIPPAWGWLCVGLCIFVWLWLRGLPMHITLIGSL